VRESLWVGSVCALAGAANTISPSRLPKRSESMIEPLKGLGMVPYVGDHDRKDPVLSPIYADMRGFPSTLCMTSTRDHCLSGTVDFHRALLRAGVDARLMVFDALPHAFWY
jgi:acetyl esterase/lipase